MSSGFPRVPLNLGLLSTLDRVGGLKTGRLPELSETLQPVLIYGDVSKSIASELFEPRAITYHEIFSDPSQAFFAGLELRSDTPGGLLVERMTVRNDYDGTGIVIGVNTYSVMTLNVIEIEKCDIGGVLTIGTVLGSGNVSVLPDNRATIPVSFFTTADLALDRIYVPPGSYFFIGGTNGLVDIHICFAWRELLDAQGVTG